MQPSLAALPEMFGWDPPAGEWTDQLQSNTQPTRDLNAVVAQPSAHSGTEADQLDGGFGTGLNEGIGQHVVTEAPWDNSAFYPLGSLEGQWMPDGSTFNMHSDYNQGGVSDGLQHDLTTVGTLQEAPATEVVVAMADGTQHAGQHTMAGPLVHRSTRLTSWGTAFTSGGAAGSSSTNVGDFLMINNPRFAHTHTRLSQHAARAGRWAPYDLQRESTPSLRRRQRELEEERGLVRDELLRRSKQLALTASLTATGTTDVPDNAGLIVSQRSPGYACPFDAACNVPVENLKQHRREFHSNIEFSRCQWRYPTTNDRCRKVLKDFGGLLKHVKQVHLKAMTCKCAKCGRDFARSDALTRHELKCLRSEGAETLDNGSTVA